MKRIGLVLAVLYITIFAAVQSPPAAASTSITGPLKRAVVLVNFQDNTSQSISVADANALVFTTVSNFYAENSYGLASVSGNTFGWYTLPSSQTNCDLNLISSEANSAAAAAGVALSGYDAVVYMFPRTSACWFDGYTIGGPERHFINGRFDLRTVAHELGHGLGLFHSHGYVCSSGIAPNSSCTYLEYGDGADVMGYQTGHFDAFQKEFLGWLNAPGTPPITTVSASGSYAIAAMEAAGTAPKALKILKSVDPSSGARTWYYVEYRQPVGFDGALANFPGLAGVQVRIGTEGNDDSSFLLDMTPGSQAAMNDLNDAALPVGQAYYDATAGVTITARSANSASATVDVVVPASASCVRANPAVALNGPTQAVTAGSTVSFTLAITNKDSSGCGASAFNLSGTVPNGWSKSLSQSSLSLAAGGSASATMTVTSPVTAAGGSYAVSGTAANAAVSGNSGSATASDTIASSTTTKHHR